MIATIKAMAGGKEKEKAKIPARYREDSTLLGTMAVERGYVTKQDVEDALEIQKSKLGTLLVKIGKLTPEQLDELLMEQAVMRGDITDSTILRKFERQKFRRGLLAVRKTLAEASAQSRSFNADLSAIPLPKVDGE